MCSHIAQLHPNCDDTQVYGQGYICIVSILLI
uniref:Uncharacterized protein n=1 Tax=Anguilla anguilla TaxID=7936 RepID=A0A0E9S3E9_ANGAN